MQDLPDVASLWIGPELSFLEILCLKSFADVGHKVTLYTYGELKNPPDFVEMADAREVWDRDDFLIHEDRGSPAIHSDVFRIKMLRQTGRIWVDADAYCLKPFIPLDGYLIGRDWGPQINSGVMALPPDSPALIALDEYLSGAGFPPWWTDAQIDEYRSAHGAPDLTKFKWGSTGPLALTHFLRESGEIGQATAPHVLYPVPSSKSGYVLRKPSLTEALIEPDTISVHFYATWLRARLKNQWFTSGSYLAKLCEKHDVSAEPPSGHPSMSAAPARRRRRRRRPAAE